MWGKKIGVWTLSGEGHPPIKIANRRMVAKKKKRGLEKTSFGREILKKKGEAAKSRRGGNSFHFDLPSDRLGKLSRSTERSVPVQKGGLLKRGDVKRGRSPGLFEGPKGLLGKLGGWSIN